MATLAIGLATSLVAAAAALLVAAACARPRGLPLAGLLRVYPDLVRLLASLSRDRRVGRAVRWRLLVALVYNTQPFNLIPDFIPVIGFADNVVVTAWAVRSAIGKAGPVVVLSNWTGSRAGFAVVCRLCRLRISYEEMESPELAQCRGAGLTAGYVTAGQPRADEPTGSQISPGSRRRQDGGR